MFSVSRSHGYIINRPATKTLIEANLPVRLEADCWPLFRDISGLTVWCLDKEIIGTSDMDKNDSALDSERMTCARQRGEQLRKLKKSYRWYQLKRIKNVLINKLGKRQAYSYSLHKPDSWHCSAKVFSFPERSSLNAQIYLNFR